MQCSSYDGDDLYWLQAIFSDESDGDGDDASPSQVVDPAKKNEGANTTLNRLIAGDFLESLGKELGLEVPPESQPYKANSSTLTENASLGDLKIPSTNEKFASTFETPKVPLENKDEACKRWPAENGKNSASAFKTCEIEVPPFNGDEHGHCSSLKDSFNISLISGVASGSLDVKDGKVQAEKVEHDATTTRSRSHLMYQRSRSSSSDTDSSDQRRVKTSKTYSRHHCGRSKTPDTDSSSDQHHSRKHRTHPRHHRNRSRTPDTDYSSDQNRAKRSRTRSRHHHGSTTPDIDSSRDCWYRGRSRSGVEKCEPQEKRKKHSRHHKQKISPDRYASHENDRDPTDDSRKDRKSGDRGRHSAKSKSDSHRKYR